MPMHPGAVADWHRDVTEANGPVSANHCSRVLRAAYKRSAKRDVSLPQRDPCSAVDYNIETSAQKAMAFRDELSSNFGDGRVRRRRLELAVRRPRFRR